MKKTIHITINICDFHSFYLKPGSGLLDFPTSLQTRIWFLTAENKYERLVDGTSLFSTGVVQKAVHACRGRWALMTPKHCAACQLLQRML